MPSPTTIVAVTSLAREALVARGSGVSVVCSQGTRLGAALHAAIHPGVSGIISFGISGGLNPELVAGDWVVASTVRCRDRAIAADSKWTQELSKRLPGAVIADIVGSDTMVPTPAEKRSSDDRRGCRRHGICQLRRRRRTGIRRCCHIMRRIGLFAAALALDLNGAVKLLR
jgi:hypothetical protein